jgi:hypothetical protein
MQTQFWWGNLKKRDHIEDLGIDGRMILKFILKTRTVLSWLRIGNSVGML